MCIFYGTTLEKSFVTAKSLENMICRLMVGGGTNVTHLQLQHTKNVFVFIPDQLQTFFLSTGNISIDKKSHNYS